MSAETLRGRVAKVLFVSRVSDYAGRTAPEIMDRCDEAADAVLAVVAADTEGIARVLREHDWDGGETLNLGYYRTEATCICGITYWGGDHDEDPSLAEALTTHQAAAVAAYLAGDPRG
ncbi:MAG: hypothetical protein JJE50_01640 [Actinomycetales bacterium]|nr:hypothetical protein [Actinomycetales bacterium]